MFLRSCYIFLVSRLLRRVHCFQRPTDGAYAIAFAGAERCSRISEGPLNPLCERVLAPEYAPRCPFRLLERRHGLADLLERGAVVYVERPCVISATRPDTPAPPGTRRPRRDGCVHRLVFDDVNANDGAWRDEDVLASGLPRVAVEPAPKRRRRRGGEPAVRFTAPLSERQAVQGQYDEQNRRP